MGSNLAFRLPSCLLRQSHERQWRCLRPTSLISASGTFVVKLPLLELQIMAEQIQVSKDEGMLEGASLGLGEGEEAPTFKRLVPPSGGNEEEGWIGVNTQAPEAARKVIVKEPPTRSMEEIRSLVNLYKQVSHCLQTQRLLMSATMWVCLGPVTIIQPAMEVVMKFVSETKGKSNHKMGSPHVQ